ncbi:MAG: hypothetical protein M3Y87_01145 [Myxococcota bacterium]|nr:hypothetical protein [Myxococcota bacterium]
MAITHDRLPPQLASLPEPARTKAVEMVNALLLEGSVSEEDAIERAHAMASQWVFERAPGDRSALAGDEENAPERPSAPERTDRS